MSVGFFVCMNQPLKLENLQLAKNGIMTHMFIFLLKRPFFWTDVLLLFKIPGHLFIGYDKIANW